MAEQQLWFLDTLVTVHVSRDGHADGLTLMEGCARHADSPPLHVHEREDELFYVLEGELRVRIGPEDRRVRAGEAALAPQGVAHTYRVESEPGARWLVVTARGDFEALVRAAARPAEAPEPPPPAGPPSPEQREAFSHLAAEHGMLLLGPPLD
jgi:mannose-6-phosphate isomerase-like protein (cupin superfamily)